MTTGNRPLSPHLEIYRPQLTSILSITHRMTGMALWAGTLLLTWWLVAAAFGPGAFDLVQSFLGHWFGKLVLLGFTYALFYHLCNGIRHLFWDVGYGFELPTLHASGWTVLAASAVLTVLAFGAGYTVAM